MKTKLFYSIIVTGLLVSCKKDNTDNSTAITDVSGKIKRITVSYVGGKHAGIRDFEYDASNRVTKFNTREEDSTTSPVKVVYRNNLTFFYNGTDEKPFKDSLFMSDFGSPVTSIYKSFFSYNAQNAVIKQ